MTAKDLPCWAMVENPDEDLRTPGVTVGLRITIHNADKETAITVGKLFASKILEVPQFGIYEIACDQCITKGDPEGTPFEVFTRPEGTLS